MFDALNQKVNDSKIGKFFQMEGKQKALSSL